MNGTGMPTIAALLLVLSYCLGQPQQVELRFDEMLLVLAPPGYDLPAFTARYECRHGGG